MSIKAFESKDRRVRTETYAKTDGTGALFSVAEPTKLGVLLTEFSQYGEVVRQEYRQSGEAARELSNFVNSELEISQIDEYKPVNVAAKCPKCGGEIVRELDTKKPEQIDKVPVVPLYICSKCGAKYYSMSDEFLSSIVHSRQDLFEPKDLEEMRADEKAFIKLLQENIIRIFASKRIFRLKIGKV